VEVIQLSLWEDLNQAAVTPVNADFLGLLEQLEAEIVPLSTITEKLDVAGEAILRLGEIYGNRAEAALEEIEYLGDREKEPVLPLNAFDCYLRQSMMVDLGQFIETPELPEVEREYHRVSVVRELSVAESIDYPKPVWFLNRISDRVQLLINDRSNQNSVLPSTASNPNCVQTNYYRYPS
jgi:hypothetical protein